jgi:gamma-glutamyltranspeptidase/glutathione hydrolase
LKRRRDTGDDAAMRDEARPTILGRRWVVSAGHPLVAAAAARVFETGGNAIDAGVAGGLAANVVQVDMCNFGGVAPILVRPAGSEQVWSVAGLGTWSREVTLEAHRERWGGRLEGLGAAVVPAAPAAWLEALARWGTWSFADCAGRAIELAEEGFVVDRALAASLAGLQLERWRENARLYGGLRAGAVLRQPLLAGLLQRLAGSERGQTREATLESVRRALYEGELAAKLASFVSGGGGWLTAADLAGFRAEVEPAVSRRVFGWELHVTPAWSQGPALLQALRILEGADLGAPGSVDHLHAVAESFRLALLDRERTFGDPRFVDVPLDELLSDERVSELRRELAAPQRARTTLPLARSSGDTTYLCTLDADGNAFSATPSDVLDLGPLHPELGILVSPRGVQSRTEPGHPSALAPGKRPRLTPSPAIAVHEDGRVWAFGCPGGDVILQAMGQAFLNVAHWGLTPQAAVEAPRVASQGFPNSFWPHAHGGRRLRVERRVPADVRGKLVRLGHDVVEWPAWEFDAGAVCMALDLEPPAPAGRVLAGAADPRRSCYALGG